MAALERDARGAGGRIRPGRAVVYATMGIYRQGAKWRASWTDPSGQQRSRSFTTKEQAQEFFDTVERRPSAPEKRNQASDWLRAFLGDGPRFSPDIIKAAEKEGVAKKSLIHAVAHELGVERAKGWWTLAAAPPPPETRRACVRCQRLIAIEDFPLGRRGRSSSCQPCAERRERLRQDGGLRSVAETNQAVSYSPDPEPARRLREHLTSMRRRGAPFEEAWRVALGATLAGVDEKTEWASWRSAFQATRRAWHRAYAGHQVAVTPLFVVEPETRERQAA